MNETHDIDVTLLSRLIKNTPQLEESTSSALLEWHGCVREGDGEKIQRSAGRALNEVRRQFGRFLEPELENLIEVFVPLEKIFRLASSVSTETQLRDHLSHTLRDFMLAVEILKSLDGQQNPRIDLLSIATIFHDIGYPIEKFKEC